MKNWREKVNRIMWENKMKNIISKILNFIALCVRIALYVVGITLMIIIIIISVVGIYMSLVIFYSLAGAVLKFVFLYIGGIVLIYWAFLRKKRDVCEGCVQNIKFGYSACEYCPYNKEKK